MAGDSIRVLYLGPSNSKRSLWAAYSAQYLSALSKAEGPIEMIAFFSDSIPEDLESGPGGMGWLRARVAGALAALPPGEDYLVHADLGPSTLREFWIAHFISVIKPDMPQCLLLHCPPHLPSFRYSAPLSGRAGFLERLIHQASEYAVIPGRKVLARHLLDHASLLLAHSRTGAEHIAQKYPHLASHIAHVTPLALGASPSESEQSIKQHGETTASTDTDILVLGDCQTEIRWDDLVGAFRQLRPMGKLAGVRLEIQCGPGIRLAYRQQMAGAHQELRALGFGRGLEIHPIQQDSWALQSALCKADILVLPFAEASCLGVNPVLLFAQSRGSALIVPSEGSLADRLEDDIDAVLYPSGDAAALSTALSNLIGNPERRKALGSALRERAMRDQNPGRVAAQMEEIYREILAARRQNRPLKLPAGAALVAGAGQRGGRG